jgi:hypothetical protein
MATTQDLRATHRVDDRMQGIDAKTDVLIDGALLLLGSLYAYSPLTGLAARYCAS